MRHILQLWTYLFTLIFMTLFAKASDDFYCHIRSIEDMTKLSFAQILKEHDQLWVISQIRPSARSGHGFSVGSYIDGDTGKIVSSPNARDFTLIEGTWRILATLTGILKKETGDYHWEAVEYSRNNTEDTAVCSPFRENGGLIICRINEKLEGADRIKPVFLLPPGWEKFVVSAWKYYQANPELFWKELAPKNREKLQKLLTDKNPLLAILACRALGEAGLLDHASMRQPLSESRESEQAALMFLLWKHTPENARSAFVETIIKMVQEAKTSEEIKGIALGALFTYEPFDGLQFELQLMKALEKKQLSLGTRTETDRYIDAIVKNELEELTQQVGEHEERKKERAAQSRSE